MNHRQFNAAYEGLTPRRRQVLQQLLAGKPDRAIAQSLYIAESTVRKHIEKICLAFSLENEFPDERRSKRPDLVALFAKYKPELVSSERAGERQQPDWQETGNLDKHRIVADRASDPSGTRTGADENVAFPTNSRMDDTAAAMLANREVYILIDRSGSMVRKDADTGKQNRYDYLAEVIEGHVAAILSFRLALDDRSGGRICDRTHLYFFSQAKTKPEPLTIEDAAQVWPLFRYHQPKTKTVISPTLEHCVNHWLSEKPPSSQGAFFLIYTDGQFDDEENFIQVMASACNQVHDRKEIRFIVLGLGQDIDIEHFLELDFNLNQTMPFNIFVFDRVNEVDDILELLARQLNDEPHLAFPDWVKHDHPELFEKLQAAVQLEFDDA